MNKNAIKKFAIDARNKLIASVTDKAGMLGITPDNCSEAITKGADFEVYRTAAGTEVTLNKKQCEQRRKLVDQIHARGFEAVVEEVAYTWFNRICAIRFMEVNDYMYPVRVRVLSSEKEGKNEPDVVTMAPDIDWEFTDKEREEIIDAKMNNRLDDLFKMLFIKQCNLLHEVLPGLFEETEDYTEMLLNISFTNEDDVIRMLIDDKRGIPEEDFNVNTIGEDGQPTGQVEIIGWLYQYYNTELKDDTFAKLKKNVKITKERIPAATQLFTPDWIVRYMVENSVGRIWIEHLRAVDPSTDEKATAEKFGWKYYLPEAEQEEAVNVKLAEIRTTYKDLKPTDITCIDPCMGSGHILIAMFDVLMDIYESAGYDKREAAFDIVENNIHGLDIDQRAYQLAYFAVMMKGRGYNRRFLRGRDGKPEPKVYAIVESNEINRNHLQFFGTHLSEMERNLATMQIEGLLDTFKNAREYGSILNVDVCDWEVLERFVDDLSTTGQISFESVGSEETQKNLQKLVRVARNLEQKYDAVVTNPPYMGNSSMSAKLLEFIKKCYPDSKSDMFAVFIESCRTMTKHFGYQAMITQHAWMSLASYEKLRYKLHDMSIVNMAHLGARAFEEVSGEMVQTTSFVFHNVKIEKREGVYYRLVDQATAAEKERAFLSGEYCYNARQDSFERIPGAPVSAYVAGDTLAMLYEKGKIIDDVGKVKIGMGTGNNDLFLKLWWEVNNLTIDYTMKDASLITVGSKKYYPYSKGGERKRWYGNQEYVVWYDEAGQNQMKQTSGHRENGGYDYYFHKGMTWTYSTMAAFGARVMPEGFVFDVNGSSLFLPEKYYNYVLCFLQSCVGRFIIDSTKSAFSIQAGTIRNLPIIGETNDEIEDLAKKCIRISREDWDSFETSWDFKKHPFVTGNFVTIKEAYEKWQLITDERIDRLNKKERRINEIFIDKYELTNELSPDVNIEDGTLHVPDLNREVRSFISYSVGCMFGRYTPDKERVVYAGDEWDSSRYKLFLPDEDNCIPITDEEYFSDDIVTRFVEFVKTVYGTDTLEENLDFIANVLGNKGDTSREVIRNYFLKDFYADHLKVYQKRPIYWMFDSGKQNGFKALIYMHRYDADTVGRVRTDYLHKAQKYVETAMQSAQYTIDNATSASEKSKATKAVTKYTKQLAEMKIYDEAIAHVANQRIEIDLDDGVKVNYAKFQGVEVAQEGKKSLKIDLLAKI